MACCAFVAFLVSQIYLMVQALGRWARGTRAPVVPSAVMWRLEAAEIPAAAAAPNPAPIRRTGASRSRLFGLVSLAVVAELAIMIGGVRWVMDGGAQTLLIDAERLASVRSFADLEIICTSRR